ncbi:MAG: thiol peroxidase [Coprobacter sp.]|nr:thiol peroxidase [Coprobacter sp.]
MATITFKGTPVHTGGELPSIGSIVPHFELVKGNLSLLKSDSLMGKRVVLNIFPSLDTGVCATTVRKFNQLVSDIPNTVVLAVSKDLPFAQSRFCTTEGIKNVIPVSAFRDSKFAEQYGVEMLDGPLAGLLARAIVVIDAKGRVVYTELVPEITREPNYSAALYALK